MEELYDLRNDPDCLDNLVGKAAYAEELEHRREQMRAWMKETGDPLLAVFEVRGEPEKVKSSPAWFDTTGMKVEQHEATSADGTRIPYFVVLPRGFEANGKNPTLLTAYGGFEVSRVPRYSGDVDDNEDDTCYRSERWFSRAGLVPPGYRIPLPPGSYRVTLHFAELLEPAREPGSRVFDVLIEGERVLEKYDTVAKVGFATADREEFTRSIEDGFLDLEFAHHFECPRISAIAIRRL